MIKSPVVKSKSMPLHTQELTLQKVASFAESLSKAVLQLEEGRELDAVKWKAKFQDVQDQCRSQNICEPKGKIFALFFRINRDRQCMVHPAQA